MGIPLAGPIALYDLLRLNLAFKTIRRRSLPNCRIRGSSELSRIPPPKKTSGSRGQEYFNDEHLDLLRALTPRHVNAPPDFWLQKVLATSFANAAMQNYIGVRGQQTDPTLAAVHGQALLLCLATLGQSI
jgi:hypothetical protein